MSHLMIAGLDQSGMHIAILRHAAHGIVMEQDFYASKASFDRPPGQNILQ